MLLEFLKIAGIVNVYYREQLLYRSNPLRLSIIINTKRTPLSRYSPIFLVAEEVITILDQDGAYTNHMIVHLITMAIVWQLIRFVKLLSLYFFA